MHYFIFPDGIEFAEMCDVQLYRLGRPYKLFPNDIGQRIFGSIELLNGMGALILDLDANIIIHKAGISNLTQGSIGALLKSFQSMPDEAELTSWAALAESIQSGDEETVTVRLGDMLPASAQAALKTKEELIQMGLLQEESKA